LLEKSAERREAGPWANHNDWDSRVPWRAKRHLWAADEGIDRIVFGLQFEIARAGSVILPFAGARGFVDDGHGDRTGARIHQWRGGNRIVAGTQRTQPFQVDVERERARREGLKQINERKALGQHLPGITRIVRQSQQLLLLRWAIVVLGHLCELPTRGNVLQ